MIADRLRACLAAEIVLIVVLAILFGLMSSPVIMAAGMIGAFVVLNFSAIVVIYIILRAYTRQSWSEPRAPWRQRLFHGIGECLALLALFASIAPFERWWLGSDAVGRLAAGRLPVLLVHGYLCNRGLWWWIRRGLRANGIAAATVNFDPPFASIDHFAGQLHQRVEMLLAESGSHQVVLVSHSMGGLVARAYLRQHGSDRVAKLVMLAAPHHGTLVARLGCGRNAREMRPESAWLRRLNASEALSVPCVSVWSRGDEFVVPHDSGRLAGAREQVVAALGHVALVFSPAVLQILQTELTRVKTSFDS